VYDALTVAGLAEVIVAAQAQRRSPEEMQAMLDRVLELSEEDVRKLLAEER
jgi:hypothetical protein